MVAARALARRGDARGGPVLIEAALGAKGAVHLALRRALLKLGTKALPALIRRQEAAEKDSTKGTSIDPLTSMKEDDLPGEQR